MQDGAWRHTTDSGHLNQPDKQKPAYGEATLWFPLGVLSAYQNHKLAKEKKKDNRAPQESFQPAGLKQSQYPVDQGTDTRKRRRDLADN
jgi:hypothetical protein